MEVHVKTNLSSSNLRTIVNALSAVLHEQYVGGVIQKQETIYVMPVAVNSVKLKKEKTKNLTIRFK